MREFIFTLIAFLAAPLIAALTLALWGLTSSGSIITDIPSFFGLAVMFYFFAVLATLVLALPAFLVLRRLDLIRWWSTGLVGFVVGVLTFILIQPPGLALVSQVTGALAWGCIGFCSAVAFWYIWRQGARLRLSGQ